MSSINAEDLGSIVKVEYSYKYKANDGRLISIKEGQEFILVKKSNADWWQVIQLEDKKPIYIPAAYVTLTSQRKYPEHPYFKKAYQALQKSKRKNKSVDSTKERPLSRSIHSGNERIIALSGSREDLTVLSASPGGKLSEMRASCDSLDRFIENENPYDEVPYEPSHKFHRKKKQPPQFEEPEYENLETIQKSVKDHVRRKGLNSTSPTSSVKENESSGPTALKGGHDSTPHPKSPPDPISPKPEARHRSFEHSARNTPGDSKWELQSDDQTGSKYYYNSKSGAMSVKRPSKPSVDEVEATQHEVSSGPPVPPAVPDASKKPSLERSRLSPQPDDEISLPLQRRKTSPARYKNSHRSPLVSRPHRVESDLSPTKRDVEDPWSQVQGNSPPVSPDHRMLGVPRNNNSSNNRSSFGTSLEVGDKKFANHKKALSDSNRNFNDFPSSPLSSKRSTHKSRSSSFTTHDVDRNSSVSPLAIWRREMSPDGEIVFIHEINGDRWHQMLDEQTGNFYYFNELTRQTLWHLPESESLGDVTAPTASTMEWSDDDDGSNDELRLIPDKHKPSSRKAKTLERDSGLQVAPEVDYLHHSASLPHKTTLGVDPGGLNKRPGRGFARQVDRVIQARSMIVLNSTNPPSSAEDYSQSHQPLQMSLSDYNLLVEGQGQGSHDGESSTAPLPHPMIERQGRMNVTKLMEAGKKQRKNWMQQWLVLLANNLLFYKDHKQATATKSTPHGKPESSCDLRGASVDWAKDKSSKKNVLEVQTVRGLSLLLQHDDMATTQKWLKAIRNTILRANQVDPLDPHPQPYIVNDRLSVDDPDDDVTSGDSKKKKEKKKKSKPPSRHGSDAKNSDKVRTKLKKFIGRRPTMESLQERGIIKESVFGCPLDKLCEKEQSHVPNFIRTCVEEVEKRGLDVDGIYRVSGNLSHVQKLRYMVDRDETIDLSDPQWEDIHLVTGALKMFLRELPEPVIPFNFFDKFIAACKIQDEEKRITSMKSLVRVLPKANGKTLKYLMNHFVRVVEHSVQNRMQVQNIAIVFGPTLLLKPPEEGAAGGIGGTTGHMAVYMVYQNQIVDYMLTSNDAIFGGI